ncbi:MAG: hypothetical protein A2W31_06475, partial [Planctomycetes bacterium RBG_16_64_10]
MTEPRPITSRYNPRVRRALRLRSRKGRTQQGRTLVDGVRELSRAMAANIPIDEVFVCETLCGSEQSQQVLAELEAGATAIWQVTDQVFDRLAFGDRHEGMVAVVRPPQRSLSAIHLPANPLVAVLEGVEKPGNLGAVLRSADGAGVAAVVVAGGGTDLFNPAAIRASLGTIFHVPVCSATADETFSWLTAQRLRIVAAHPEGARLYTGVDYRAGTAVVLGSEATGLSPRWRMAPCEGIRLPQLGVANSLTVAAAAAVLFYEALR